MCWSSMGCPLWHHCLPEFKAYFSYDAAAPALFYSQYSQLNPDVIFLNVVFGHKGPVRFSDVMIMNLE